MCTINDIFPCLSALATWRVVSSWRNSCKKIINLSHFES